MSKGKPSLRGEIMPAYKQRSRIEVLVFIAALADASCEPNDRHCRDAALLELVSMFAGKVIA